MTTPSPSGNDRAAALAQRLAGGSGTPSTGAVSGSFSWDDNAKAWWGIDYPVAQNRVYTEVRAGTPGAESYTPDVDGAPGAPVHGVSVETGVIMQQLNAYSRRDLMRLQERLKAAGLLKNYVPGLPDDKTRDAFGNLLQEASRAALTDNRMVTWQGYLLERIQAVQSDPEASGVGGDGSGGPSRSTFKQIYQLDETAARPALRDMIGRDPSRDELDKFMASYNSAAKRSASTQTTVSDGNGNTTQTTVQSDPQEIARQAAMENPDYANYQAVATYFPMIDRVLSGMGQTDVIEDGM
jgi:hypothetical protein